MSSVSLSSTCTNPGSPPLGEQSTPAGPQVASTKNGDAAMNCRQYSSNLSICLSKRNRLLVVVVQVIERPN